MTPDEQIKQLTELVEAQRLEIERLTKDAFRYRWLRDIGDANWRPFRLREGYGSKEADMAIDKAIMEMT